MCRHECMFNDCFCFFVSNRVCSACCKKLELAEKLNQKHVLHYLASSNPAIRGLHMKNTPPYLFCFKKEKNDPFSGVVLAPNSSLRTTSDAPHPQTSPSANTRSNPRLSFKRSQSFPPREAAGVDDTPGITAQTKSAAQLVSASDDEEDRVKITPEED